MVKSLGELLVRLVIFVQWCISLLMCVIGAHSAIYGSLS
jgi:hypothetical protein